jgi:hypothetical protein
MRRVAIRSGCVPVMFLAAALFAVGGCSGEKPDGKGAADSVKIAGEEKNDAFAAVPAGLVMRRLDGKEVSMGEYRGQLVVMYFWASWHNDSRTLVEIMNSIHRKFSRSYQFFAVSMDKGGEPVIWNFMRDEYILCDVIVNGDEVARTVGGVGRLPTVLVILRDGRIVRRLEGLYKRRQYEDLLAGIRRYRRH